MDINNIGVKSGPKDVFMYLLAIFTLYISVVSFIELMFAYINAIFPDQLTYNYTGILDQIRISSSTLTVVFAVFILLSWILGKDLAAVPEKRELRVRKWLIYFTLFISAITIIVDLIILIYRFYSGDYTTQFFLKVLVVLAVAAAVFGYYLWDLRRGPEKSGKPKMFAWIAMLVVLAAVIGGFFIVGSPATQRDRRFDEQRVSDLQNIQSRIINYWQTKNKLPNSLGDLTDSISGFAAPVDPQTGTAYDYNIKGPLVFDLCATFKTDSKNETINSRLKTAPMPVSLYGDPYQQNWSHGIGNVCFDRTIDPQLYKIPNPPVLK